jgi:hypothetical protein
MAYCYSGVDSVRSLAAAAPPPPGARWLGLVPKMQFVCNSVRAPCQVLSMLWCHVL